VRGDPHADFRGPGALRGAGRIVVRNYLERCASAGIKAGREQEVYDEVMDVIFKLTR